MNFDELDSRVRQARVRGWLQPREAATLWQLAVSAPAPIVEVGTFMGLSTCYLAGAQTAPVYSVDPHDPALLNPTQRDWAAGRDVAELARENFLVVGVLDHITQVRGTAQDSADRLPEVIGLLFIDADHHPAAVTRDLDTLGPRVAQGGFLVLHDWGVAGDEGGLWDVRGAAEAWVAQHGGEAEWGTPRVEATLAVYHRTAAQESAPQPVSEPAPQVVSVEAAPTEPPVQSEAAPTPDPESSQP